MLNNIHRKATLAAQRTTMTQSGFAFRGGKALNKPKGAVAGPAATLYGKV